MATQPLKSMVFKQGKIDVKGERSLSSIRLQLDRPRYFKELPITDDKVLSPCPEIPKQLFSSREQSFG